MGTEAERCTVAGGLLDLCNTPGLFDWLVGLAGLVGLGIAIGQLIRSANALKAAKETYESTRTALALGQLSAIYPDLVAHSSSLDKVMNLIDRPPAVDALTKFAHQATTLASLLEIASTSHGHMVEELKETAKEALNAVDRMGRFPVTVTNGEIGRNAASSMRETVRSMGGAITSLRNTPIVANSRKGRD